MSAREKIVELDAIAQWRDGIQKGGGKLVTTNGCFDLLHAGHVTYLEEAAKLGDVLMVGINGDDSVRQLKGDGRPLNSSADRALVVAALASVGAVCVFPEMRAERFLQAVSPDVYVKGGDYTLDSLDPSERRVVEEMGGEIAILPLVRGKSTTGLIQKMEGD